MKLLAEKNYVVCEACWKVWEYSYNDISEEKNWSDGVGTTSFVVCPCCDAKIEVANFPFEPEYCFVEEIDGDTAYVRADGGGIANHIEVPRAMIPSDAEKGHFVVWQKIRFEYAPDDAGRVKRIQLSVDDLKELFDANS